MQLLDDLWKAATQNPEPLFETDSEDTMVALFNAKGFFLSATARKQYDQEMELDGKKLKLKDLPHIYATRTQSENDFYIGISNQKGGRWKRSHAYHLRTLAHQILHAAPLRSRGDQDHWQWIESWFT
jgi:hypothetical protein